VPIVVNGKPQDNEQCAYTDSAGRCVYVRDKKGNLKFSDEQQKKVYANYNAIQNGAAITNDTFTALSIVAANYGWCTRIILGGLFTFGSLVASITTGSGFRPFGFNIIPKSAPPPGC
jgi:hypothetical protein